jgi:hypothetical protein
MTKQEMYRAYFFVGWRMSSEEPICETEEYMDMAVCSLNVFAPVLHILRQSPSSAT